MSKIRSLNTRPEIMFRKALFALGYRYRVNDKKLPGKPDVVLPKYKTAIFVHGCFWHCHSGCREGRVPTSNVDYWQTKLAKNIARDKNNCELLAKLGWRVIIIWECEIEKKLKCILEDVEKKLAIR